MIKNIIARGIGFTPGSVRYIVTHGFASAAGPEFPTTGTDILTKAVNRRRVDKLSNQFTGTSLTLNQARLLGLED